MREMMRLCFVAIFVAMALGWSATANAIWTKTEVLTNFGFLAANDLTKAYNGMRNQTIIAVRNRDPGSGLPCFNRTNIVRFRQWQIVHLDDGSVPPLGQCEVSVAVSGGPAWFNATAAFYTINGVPYVWSMITVRQVPQWRTIGNPLIVKVSNDASAWKNATGAWPPKGTSIKANKFEPSYPEVGLITAENVEFAVVDTPYDLDDLYDDFLDAQGLTWKALPDLTLDTHEQGEFNIGERDAGDVIILRMDLTPQDLDKGKPAREIFQFTVEDAKQVPSLTVWGLVTLGLILMIAAVVTLSVRRRAGMPA